MNKNRWAKAVNILKIQLQTVFYPGLSKHIRSSTCPRKKKMLTSWQVSAAAWHGLVCKANGRGRPTVFPFQRRRKQVVHCFTMYFRMWFSIPALYNSLWYRKLSQRLHVLLLWWFGTVVTALRPLKSGVRKYISPRINFRLYVLSIAGRYFPPKDSANMMPGGSALVIRHCRGLIWILDNKQIRFLVVQVVLRSACILKEKICDNLYG